MPSLFAGLPTPSWSDPERQSAQSSELAMNLVQGWREAAKEKANQTGTQAQLKVDEMKQNLQINQAELNNQAADQSTIPQWMQDHPTWASRQDADWPTAKSSWGEKALQQTQLRDNQSSQKEFTVNAITGFQDRLNKLAAMGGDASDAATVVAQLPRDQKTNLPSPQAVMQLNQAEKLAMQQARQNKITDAVAVDTAKEKLGEQRDASKLAGQQTRDSQKHEWVVENIDHRYDLSAQTAAAKFTNQKNLAKFNQEATVIRSSTLSPEQQADRMRDLELKYKADFKGNGAFHDFQDDGTPKDDAMAPAAGKAMGGYTIGTVYKGGMTYLGGDPKNKSSWNQSISDEP